MVLAVGSRCTVTLYSAINILLNDVMVGLREKSVIRANIAAPVFLLKIKTQDTAGRGVQETGNGNAL